MTEAPHPTSTPAASETYTPGYSQAVVTRFQERTLATCADFFVPHLRPGMTVLDCGCGPGSLTLDIAGRVAPGQVVGIDIDAGQCARAQETASARGITNVRFEPADVYALPYADGAFDAVFSHALISHLAEPMRAFAESRRVLKPGGVLAVSANDYDALLVSPDGSAAAELIGSLYTRMITHNGGNQLLARHLRGALVEAGFVRVEGHGGVEVWGTLERTRNWAEFMAAVARGPGFVDTVLAQGWADQAEMAALPDELLRWAERPDAVVAMLKGGALGWVDER